MDNSPTRIVISESIEPLTGSHSSTLQLSQDEFNASQANISKAMKRGSSVVRGVCEIEENAGVPNEDRTIISKRMPGDDSPPPLHVSLLDSRKSLEGETVDHFHIQEYVGGGGMGAVYRGVDVRLNRPVAIKVLARDQADSETVRRFRNEAQSAARLDHPNISRVFYIGEDKGWNFIVFEFIEGANLRHRVEQKGPLPFDEALSYTLQIAEALDHAQARDVVHRDIKPSNILVSDDGNIKLVDMGLARSQQLSADNEDLTASGVTLGTFDYISPEQARDPRTADVRSDMYSLGCTLYFMLAGRPPFPEGTALQKLLWHTGDDPPDVRLFRPDVPDEFVALLTRLLAKKPEQRFQTAQDLIGAIIQISQRQDYHFDSSSVSRLTPVWPDQPVQSRAPWWQQYTPLLVAVVLILVVALWPEGSQPTRTAQLLNLPTAISAQPVVVSPITTNSAETPAKSSETKTVAPTPTTTDVVGSIPDSTNPAKASSEEKVTAPTIEAPMSITPPANTTEPKTESTTPTPVVAIQTVVVKPEMGESTLEPTIPGTVVVSSFAEAIRFAAIHPECNAIELAFTGSHALTTAVEITSRRLTLRAASGFTPELVFRPSPDAEQRTFFRIRPIDSLLSLEGIRMRAEIPVSTSDWSLFQIPPEASLDVSQSAFTVVNSTNNTRHAATMTVFDCVASSNQNMRIDKSDESSELPTSRLVVKNCILRGDADVCRIAEDHPVRFTMSDSFVATSGHLLETGGVASKPRWMDRTRVSLQQCTLVTDAGLILAGSNVNQPFRMEVRLDLESNVVISNRTSPILEYRGGDTGDEAKLSFEGNDNYYPRTNTFFRRVAVHDGVASVIDMPLGELPRWARDRNAEQGSLANSPSDLSWHDVTPADFILKSASDEAVGCHPASLPVLEATPRRPIKSATNMGGLNGDMPATIAAPIMDEKATMRPMNP